MNAIDVVVGTFPTTSEASAAAADIASTLPLDEEFVSTERVRVPGDGPGVTRVVLVAWVPTQRRLRVRDLIWRHGGRQVPFDWLNGRSEMVVPESFPAVPVAA